MPFYWEWQLELCLLSDFPGIRSLSHLNDLNSLNKLSGLNDLYSLISSKNYLNLMFPSTLTPKWPILYPGLLMWDGPSKIHFFIHFLAAFLRVRPETFFLIFTVFNNPKYLVPIFKVGPQGKKNTHFVWICNFISKTWIGFSILIGSGRDQLCSFDFHWLQMLLGTDQFPFLRCEKQCAMGYFQSDPAIKEKFIHQF